MWIVTHTTNYIYVTTYLTIQTIYVATYVEISQLLLLQDMVYDMYM